MFLSAVPPSNGPWTLLAAAPSPISLFMASEWPPSCPNHSSTLSRAAEDAEDAAEADAAMDELATRFPGSRSRLSWICRRRARHGPTPLMSGRVPAARCGSSTRLSVRRSPRSSMDSPPIRALLVSQP